MQTLLITQRVQTVVRDLQHKVAVNPTRVRRQKAVRRDGWRMQITHSLFSQINRWTTQLPRPFWFSLDSFFSQENVVGDSWICREKCLYRTNFCFYSLFLCHFCTFAVSVLYCTVLQKNVYSPHRCNVFQQGTFKFPVQLEARPFQQLHKTAFGAKFSQYIMAQLLVVHADSEKDLKI